MSVDEVKSCVLAGRNLAIAGRVGNPQMIAPCSACYLVFNKAQHYLHDVPAIKETVNKALHTAGMKCPDHLTVRHPLDVLVNDVGLAEIKQRVKQPLKGLKVAPYYGCQIVRPYATFDDQYNPTTMDRLLEALGATVVYFPLKTRCCGGSLTGTLPEPGLLCSSIILREAIKRQADVITTVCSLCQFNLEGYHDKIEARFGPARIPAVYFTQLIALAFDLPPDQIALHRGLLPMKFWPKEPAAA
jgi:heterodisulfide reductase subunit B